MGRPRQIVTGRHRGRRDRVAHRARDRHLRKREAADRLVERHVKAADRTGNRTHRAVARYLRTGQVAGDDSHVVQVQVRAQVVRVVVPEADVHVGVQRDPLVRRQRIQVQRVVRVRARRTHRQHVLPARTVPAQVHVQAAPAHTLGPEVQVHVRLARLARQVHRQHHRLRLVARGRTVEHQVTIALVRTAAGCSRDGPLVDRRETPIRRGRGPALKVLHVQLRLRRRRRPDRRGERQRPAVAVGGLPVDRVAILVHRIAGGVRDVRTNRQVIFTTQVLVAKGKRKLRVPAAAHSSHRHRADHYALRVLQHHVIPCKARRINRLVECHHDRVQRTAVVSNTRRRMARYLWSEQIHLGDADIIKGKTAIVPVVVVLAEANLEIAHVGDTGRGNRRVEINNVMLIEVLALVAG